ncbi:hypothetical protein WHR41_05500 [Cladosporium halotolerans]|uniref:Major facilitator superfamily (MFS) profile domain-containing protein n=1 Tax=Cladosporium halotolerans TaxID=1052096 RepID=A0AB34KQ84_9PEZI
MFYTHQDRDDDYKPSRQEVIEEKNNSDSSYQSHEDDLSALERIATQEDHESYEESHKTETNGSRRPQQHSLELRQTASNVLDRVASRITTRSIRDPPPPPDGGFQAWLQVAMGWLIIFVTWGYVNSFGSFQAYYTQTLPEDASTISWIGSIQVFLTFFIGAFSGRLLDAGLFVPTLFVGGILQLLGIFMMSLSTKWWQLLLSQGVLTGIGGGIFFCPSMGLIATYFSNRRALAVGITSTGNSVGGMIYPILTRELLPKIGFAWTTRVLGFLNLGLLAIAFAFMRPRLPPRATGPIIDWKAFTEPVYVLFVGGIFFVLWNVYFTFYYIASYGIENAGLPYSASTTLVIIINGVGIPARIIPPFFADKFGPLNTVVPVLFCVAIVSYTWLAVDSTTGFYIFTVFYGMINASFQCLIPTAVASLTPNLNVVGTRLGMAFATISFAALTGPPIGGVLQSANNGSFVAPQVWASTSALLCAFLVLGARFKKGGWDLKARC